MEVKDVANYLLNHCYIMGEVEETRDRYYYAINHLEELKKLFIQLGYTLALDRNTWESVMRTLKDFNLAKQLDRLNDATAHIEIYPSVILALPDNVLRAGQEETEKELAKYKASEEDDE